MRTYAIRLLAAALLGFGLFWFFSNYQYEQEETYVGYQGIAARNYLLAAERFLSNHTEIHTLRSINPLWKQLSPEASVILFQQEYTLLQTEAERLLSWVEAEGGRLILTSAVLHDEAADTEDFILNALQLKQYSSSFFEDDNEYQPTEFIWDNTPVTVGLSLNYYLAAEHKPPQMAVGSDYGLHLLRYEWGRGTIIVLSDLWFIENPLIDQYDNAWFLWQLAGLADNPDRPVFLLNLTAPSIPALPLLLWQHAWPVILTLAALLVAWLWRYSQRFGPLLPRPEPHRRSLLEHIEANGYFLWRHTRGAHLLRELRDTVQQQVVTLYPHDATTTDTEILSQLAERYALPLAALQRAFQDTPPTDEADFTQRVQLLAKLRKLL
jgi:hypothetical protein